MLISSMPLSSSRSPPSLFPRSLPFSVVLSDHHHHSLLAITHRSLLLLCHVRLLLRVRVFRAPFSPPPISPLVVHSSVDRLPSLLVVACLARARVYEGRCVCCVHTFSVLETRVLSGPIKAPLPPLLPHTYTHTHTDFLLLLFSFSKVPLRASALDI